MFGRLTGIQPGKVELRIKDPIFKVGISGIKLATNELMSWHRAGKQDAALRCNGRREAEAVANIRVESHEVDLYEPGE